MMIAHNDIPANIQSIQNDIEITSSYDRVSEHVDMAFITDTEPYLEIATYDADGEEVKDESIQIPFERMKFWSKMLNRPNEMEILKKLFNRPDVLRFLNS